MSVIQLDPTFLKRNITDAVIAGDLPDIEFRKDGDLARVFATLTNSINLDFPADATDEQKLENIVGQLIDMSDNSDFLDVFADMDTIALRMASATSKALVNLREDVSSTVDELVAEVREAQRVWFMNNGYESLVSQTAEPVCDFNTLSWASVRSKAVVDEVVSTVHNALSVFGNEANTSYFPRAFEKFVTIIPRVRLGEEHTTKIVEALQSMRGVADGNAERICNYITGGTSAHLIGILRPRPENEGINKQVNQIRVVIEEIENLLKAISEADLQLTEATTTALRRNGELLKQYMDYARYVMHTCRTTLFKDKLIITENTLNGDELNEFEKQGGTKTHIAHHLRIFHSKLQVPVYGIATSVVLNNRDNVASRIEKQRLENESRRLVLENDSLNNAVAKVLNNYFATMAEEEGVTLSELRSREANRRLYQRVSNYLHGKEANLEDAMYIFVLGAHYDGRLEQTLYNSLSTAYIRSLAKHGKLQDSDVGIADTVALTHIVSKFIMQNFCSE